MNRKALWASAVVLVLVAGAIVALVYWKPEPPAPVHPTPQTRAFKFVEKVVADLGPTPPAGTKKGHIWRSPDGATLVYRVTRGWDAILMINGMESPPYDAIGSSELLRTGKPPTAVVFSPDGGRLAYIARKDRKWFAVIDGVKGPEYNLVRDIQFSADGKRVMYYAMVLAGESYLLVLDGKTWRESDKGFGKPAMSDDGQHIVWQTRKFLGIGPKGFRLVIDGVAGPLHDDVRVLKATDAAWAVVLDRQKVSVIRVPWPQPGARRLVEKRMRVVGDTPGTDRLGRVYASPNKEAAGFIESVRASAGIPAGRRVVCNGLASGQHEAVSVPAFSADGSHAVWVVRNKGMCWVVRDGQGGPRYGAIGTTKRWWRPEELPVFSPDGERLAYKAVDDDRAFIVCDDRQGPRFLDVGVPLFSPDGKHLAYTATVDQGTRVLLDGKGGPVYDDVAQLSFSGDSAHLAHVAERAGKRLVVCDGAEGSEYDGIAPLRFSPDSRHLMYAARRGDKWFMVVDGVEGPPHEKAWIDARMDPSLWPTGAFRYLTLDGGREALVEVHWPSDLDRTHAPKPVAVPFEQRVRDRIEEFSSAEFAVRERALEKLIAMGPDALPLAKKALAATHDFEVKRRCKFAIIGIVLKPVATSPAPARPDLPPDEAVREVTKTFMTAVGADDMKTFAKLAVEDSPAWRMRGWPRIAREVRVLYAAHPDRLTAPAEFKVAGDVAAVGLPPAGDEKSLHFVLILKDTPAGWRVCRMEERYWGDDLAKCLEEHLKREAAVKQFGVKVGEPIDRSFIFERGRYVEAPYVIERWGLEVYLNDIRVSRHSKPETCERSREREERMLQGGMVLCWKMGSSRSGMSHERARQFVRLHIGDVTEEEGTALLGRRSLREGWEITRRRMATGYEHSPQLLERWKKAMRLTLREAVDLDRRIQERKVAEAKTTTTRR